MRVQEFRRERAQNTQTGFRVFAAVLTFAALAGCSRHRYALRAALVDRVPKPNRVIEIKSLWSKTKPLSVHLRRAMGTDAEGRIAVLRAIHDGQSLSILAVWGDATGSGEPRDWNWDAQKKNYSPNDKPKEDIERRSWILDPRSRQYYLLETPTDLFAVKFCIGGSPKACMMSGEEGVFDVWEWRAGWSHVSGYADDRKLTISRTDPGSKEVKVYSLPGMKNVIYMLWQNDAGDLPYVLTPRPTRPQGPAMPGIKAQNPTGSAGDVLAEAVYQNKTWMLELWRALDTGHDDDYPIKGRGPHDFSIALTDDQEGAEHFTSDLISLYLDR